MNIDKINSTNFNGYKNILATKWKDKNTLFTVLTVQLNNEGAKDLDKWLEIQQNLFKNQIPTKAITVSFLKGSPTYDFCVNSRSLSRKDQNAMFQQSEESFVLKLYTLLSDITKRICETEIPHNDFEQQTITAPAMLTNLMNMYEPRFASTITNHSLLGATDEEKRNCAQIINERISKIMEDYFA